MKEKFKFPEKEELKILLKDILEVEVDEKYYLKEKQIKKLSSTFINNVKEYSVIDFSQAKREKNPRVYEEVSPTLASRDYKEPRCVKIVQLNNPKHSNNRVYSDQGVSPTLRDMSKGGNRQPFIISSTQKHNSINNNGVMNCLPSAMGMGGGHTPMVISQPLKFLGRNQKNLPEDYAMCVDSSNTNGIRETNIKCLNPKKQDGSQTYQQDRIYKSEGILPALSSQLNGRFNIENNFRIRKLTPKECFRLMGFLDDKINLGEISNSQQYKLAGNGWDINLVSKIMKEMNLPEGLRLFEMFAGYGGASFSLKKLGIDFECIGTSEIDKYAMQCYTQNHKGYHWGDCTKIDTNELPDFDFLTGGFPCQSFSVAGKGKGELDPRGTLFYEIVRIAEVKKPKYILLENVKGLTNKKHKPTFNKILSELERIGYDVYWKVLNSREHGIPQNRERVFFVCFRKDLGMGQEIKQETLMR